MTISARLQLLTCLSLYAASAQAIMVKFGTNEGPIVPEVPVPSTPPPKPYRNPAPVWEERANDSPDPNTTWRPSAPQPRYTQVIFFDQNSNNAKQFVNSYIPKNPKPIQAEIPSTYFKPSQMVSTLSSQNLPGIGIRYFVPYFVNIPVKPRDDQKRHEDAKWNDIQTNDIDTHSDADSDAKWKADKNSVKRFSRNSKDGTPSVNSPFVYEWPVYLPHRQH